MACASSRKSIHLVDGTSQLFRAYFALPGLTSPEGIPTNAVFGFTTMLRKLINEEAPDGLAVAFDLPGRVFRNETYPDYKANRPPTPEDLNVQVPFAKQVCAILGGTVLEEPGFEADDLIATYARIAREAGYEVVVVASDKDLLQLVGDGVTVLNPSKNLTLDAAGVAATFGVPPERVPDAQGLMGDSVDNIPGVPGVGGKSAIAIVSVYGDLESILERAERFVDVYDARDAVLQIMERAETEGALEESTATRLRQALADLERRLRSFAAAEADDEMRQRAVALAGRLSEAGVDVLEVGAPGKKALQPIRPLRKELKALDKGSARKMWYAIHDNTEQARLSKRLATLHTEVDPRHDLDALVLRDPDRSAARDLFGRLGFKALIDEYAPDAANSAAPAEGGPAVTCSTALTAGELRALVAACRASGRAALVPTTDRGDPMQAQLIGLAVSPGEGQADYVPVAHAYLGAPTQPDLDLLVEHLGPLLGDASVVKLGHDWKFADHVLRRHGLPVRGWGTDPMVAAFLLDAARNGFGLEGLARDFLSQDLAPISDVLGSGSGRIAAHEAAVESMTANAAARAEVTLRLAARLERRLEESELRSLYDTIDGPLLPVLSKMEAHGIRVDLERLERMSVRMDETLERTRGAIHALAGEEFNVDSPKQMRTVLFEKLGLKSRRKTAKGKLASTDAQTLEELAGQHQIARRILEYRETSKLKSTYVDSLPRLVHPETGRVHTCYHPTGAATGRLSSSDPNLQNIPVRSEAGRQIRSAFVPEEGCVFLASDYSQIELRVLAHMTEDENLVQAFAAGEDIHCFTASKVFGVALDLVTDPMRRRAKAVNFGILYGMSETRLAREQGMKRAEARQFIQNYFDRFASVRGYIDSVREQALRDGSVRTLFGRIRPFPQLHGRINRGIQEQALRAAVNTTLQGTAADLMKLAMLAVDRELEAAGLGARMLLQVHDELLLEVPEAELASTRKIVREAMEGVHPLAVPLVVDQKSGASWMET